MRDDRRAERRRTPDWASTPNACAYNAKRGALIATALESRLDEARASGRIFSVHEVLDFLIPITDALSAAHAAGIAQDRYS